MKRYRSAGFTLVELLVVLAVVAVLLALQLPALTRAQDQSRQAECAANLKQLTLAELVYGSEFNDRLPTVTAGGWAWNVPPSFTDQLAKYGAQRAQFYCPANAIQNQDGLWNFSGQYRVTGYVQTFPGTSTIALADLNPRFTPLQTRAGTVFLSAPISATRVLVADAIISLPGQTVTANKITYAYTGIAGGYAGPPPGFTHRTSHLDMLGRYPTGANVGMLDGHVEWRNFSSVSCHTVGGNPGFWW